MKLLTATLTALIACYSASMPLPGSAESSTEATGILLPNNWTIEKPPGEMISTGTMPQGAALSPDGATIAVVESGFNPPALALYVTKNLQSIRRVSLSGAFGRPVWIGKQILVAGANADAIFEIDSTNGHVQTIAIGKKTYPVSVAIREEKVAVACDGDGSLRIGSLDSIAQAHAISIGRHPGGLAFAIDGSRVFVAIRSQSDVANVSVRDGTVTRIPTNLHPADVLVRAQELFVAEADADTVGVFDTANGRRIASIYVGTATDSRRPIGASPNALAGLGDNVYVSLGAANQIAIIRENSVVARIGTGWYPTDVVPTAERLYVIDGKGEGMKPNPSFNFRGTSNTGYIAAIENGSIRAKAPGDDPAVSQTGPVKHIPPPADTVIRKDGPIKHVFFILKENRSYDQVLGDLPQGNSDPKLTAFGNTITPNQHALVRRFGLFDNAYASGEVSDPGHNWADGAFANDYVERWWPSTYGDRRDDDDTVTGTGAGVAAKGYIWDAARAAGVSFRDYGEMGTRPPAPPGPTAPGLRNHFDARYIGWDLNYSDLDRVKEWQREFNTFLAAGTLPQFEYLWLPNDHTQGSRPGKLTPEAYVAQNDYAVGLLVQAVSHSRVWRSSAIFLIEDDAQDGADHVSAQRTTMYLVSPYARGGLVHEHYSTLSILRTIEAMLGMEPLSAYDASALPMYAAFATKADLKAFNAIPPRIDITKKNAKTAYAARASELANFERPDATPPGFLRALLARL